MFRSTFLIFASLFTFVCSPVIAAETPTNAPPQSGGAGKDAKDKEKSKEPEEKIIQSRHGITIDGKHLDYTATAGTILLRDEEEDKPTASIFYIAYIRDDVKDSATRPLTFSFNGGPGSSSVWMHMGMLGPRRVHLAEDGGALPPPYRLQDN